MNLIVRTKVPSFQYSVWRPKSLFTKTKVFFGLTLGFSFILYRQSKERYRQMHSSNLNSLLQNIPSTQENQGEKKVDTNSIWSRMWRFLGNKLRILLLIIKFTPLAFTLPFALLFSSLYPWWIKYMIFLLQSEIVFLDPGMVALLKEGDLSTLIKLVIYVTLRNSYECGQIMLQLAQLNQKDIDENTKAKFMMEMQNLFTEVCKAPLAKMNTDEVLRQMLLLLRQNGILIDNHFSTILDKMTVLEGLEKQLDPSLNIVSKAASFLIYIRTIDKSVDEIIQKAL